MSTVIENVQVNGNQNDLHLSDGKIKSIGELPEDVKTAADTCLDGSEKLAVPTFHNGHTHAAMTLFRGFGDDMPLQQWLEDKIWPLEEQLSADDVYWATRLACQEMISSGTTFFNDMYWEFDAIRRAVADSGIRAMISGVFIDQFDEEMAKKQRKQNKKLHEQIGDLPDRIQFALGPHSIYTVSQESLEWIAEFSRKHELPVHIHLSETEWEVQQCRDQHGTTPVRYLSEIGFLHENVVAAHCIWLEDEEIEILGERDVSVVYNPLSNLKLNAGSDFRYEDLREAGVDIVLGTDSVASNNNFDMTEEIKMAALLQKNRQDDPTVLPAEEALNMATRRAADIFDLNTGVLEEGRDADLTLVDTTHPALSLIDVHDRQSHLSYTLPSEAIDTVVCDGAFLMRDGQFTDSNSEDVRARHRERTRQLCYE